MTEDKIEKLIILLGQRIAEQNAILQDAAISLHQIAWHAKQFAVAANPGPNYRKPLADYKGFDWSLIGAEVVRRDDDGVAAVEWNGRLFTRRAPGNKFDAAIWFSRCIGKDDAGGNRYEKLITFKDSALAEEIAPKTRRLTLEGAQPQ